MLDDVGGQWNYWRRPAVRGQQRLHRKDAVIDAHLLANRRVEFVFDQAFGEVPRKGAVAREVGKVTFAPSFVRLRMRLADPQREGRVGVEEEPVHMIVVDNDHQVWSQPIKPNLRRFVTLKQWRPYGVLLQSPVV